SSEQAGPSSESPIAAAAKIQVKALAQEEPTALLDSGRLKTSLKSGCPQLGKVAGGVRFDDVVDAFVSNRLIVDLEDAVGWEVMKSLPFNRSTRQLCKVQGLELVVLDNTTKGLLVDDDTLLGIQPMWLWTLASLAKGEGAVVHPFAEWSNSTEFGVPGVRSLPPVSHVEEAPLDPEWPNVFKGELSLALFGLAIPQRAEEEPTSVKVVEAADAYLLTDPNLPSGPVSFKPPAPEVQAVTGEHANEGELGNSSEVPEEPLRSGGDGEGQCVGSGASVDVQAPSGSIGAKVGGKAKGSGAASRMTEAERERWRRHIAAHHIPFRKDCIQCVMSGALGLQHRRVKCPTMYALAFDLAGPFKELGRDDRGGKYKYVLVAGLRVPEAALPSPKHSKGTTEVEAKASEAQAEIPGGNEQDDDAASEASWLREQLTPNPAVMKVGEDGDSSQEEDECSEADWFEAPFVDDVAPSEAEAIVEADDGPDVEGGVGLDVDPWEDAGGFSEMTDEKFDEALSEMLFSGANKVLRFAVPLKARKGPLILAGLQEVVTECNRLGYPVKIVHTDRAKELMSKATMDWLQSNLIQPSFTQGLGVEQWPSAMAFACAEHRKSKRPFLRWEHAVYLCPTPRTEGGHVLLRAASSAYLVAKNVRCVEEMIDPEAEFGNEEIVEADPPEPGFDHSQGGFPTVPSRRVTGKRAVRSVQLAPEVFAENLLQEQLFTSDHCGRLLQLAFGGVEGGTRREHRGPIGFSVIFGAYSHGGLQGITRASRMYPMVCRYLNEYLRRCSPNELAENEWSSLMVVVADEVAMHRDVRLPGVRARPYPPPPGRAAMMVRRKSSSVGWVDGSVCLEGEPRLLARVVDFADDGPTEESPFPDRMLMFSVHDVIRDVLEMVILRVEARRPPQEEQPQEVMNPILQPPGPPPPEVRAVKFEAGTVEDPTPPLRLPIPLPNPAFIRVVPEQPVTEGDHEVLACKAEATTTKDLGVLLSQLHEPLSVTHTASQEEVRANLEKWRPAIEKELGSLKKQGVLISCCGQKAEALIENPDTTVISLKGVFKVKAPGGPDDGWFKRKCRLVGCGNQATHVDADSLYAAGAPAEAVRVALTQAYHHKWGAFTTDIKSAFTQTPIPAYAAQRYLLRPPRWLIDLGLAEPGEYYSLGMVLYGFKEAPAWWSDHRDAKLKKAVFAGCHLEQGTADSSVWRIMKGKDLKGYLVTYVDDFLVLSEKSTAEALHQWLLSEAGWETDGLSEASPGHPVRFLGMQLHGYEDGHFSLDQGAYVDELVRTYKLSEANRSKIVCPKEILMHVPETVQQFDEQTVKSAQKVAGECLWLAQRSRIDIAFATTVLCSKVSKDPHGAIAIGQRVMAYLHHTKDFKLHLKPTEGVAPLRVFTDASFAPLGQHSYGGHIIEVSGVPVLWKASKQPLISLSSSEAELIQAVEGCMYAESLMTILWDLAIPFTSAELCLDNTASIAFVQGVSHCPGEYQKADILTKALPSARMQFLCRLLQLGGEGVQAQEPQENSPAIRSVGAVPNSCLASVVALLQFCKCCGEFTEEEARESGVSIEWPWELGVLTLLIVLSTLFLWETACSSCRRQQPADARVCAVSAHKERRAKKLQDRVAAAIDTAMSESPTGDE
ncbi:GIP, partial [Symbiodinium necroappetens]